MLVQYTSVASLDAAAKARLTAAASGLVNTMEAQRGYVVFEGKYFSVQEVNNLTGSGRQFLTEG